MKKELIVRLKDAVEIQFRPMEVKSPATLIDLPAVVAEYGVPILLMLENEKVTTTLDLTGLTDCVLLHLEETNLLSSVTYCSNDSDGSFLIQTQAKTVLLLPTPIPFYLEEITAIVY